MNYKSLDCYQNFANGWVREVLCKKFGENRLLIAKVSFHNFLLKSARVNNGGSSCCPFFSRRSLTLYSIVTTTFYF